MHTTPEEEKKKKTVVRVRVRVILLGLGYGWKHERSIVARHITIQYKCTTSSLGVGSLLLGFG